MSNFSFRLSDFSFLNSLAEGDIWDDVVLLTLFIYLETSSTEIQI